MAGDVGVGDTGGNAGTTENNWFTNRYGSEGGPGRDGGNCIIGEENRLGTIIYSGTLSSGAGGDGGGSCFSDHRSTEIL